MVDLSVSGEATLHCDLNRLLPATDPFSRQIVIGLGCFLELLRQAAAQEGLRAEVTPFPEGEDPAALDLRPIAHIRFAQDQSIVPDPLFAQVVHRRSNKEVYDTGRQVAPVALTALATSAGANVRAGWTNDAARVAAFRELTFDALKIEMYTDYTMQESIDLMRIGKQEINETPDGLAFGGPMFDTLHLFGLMTREALGDENSIGFQQGIEIWDGLMMSAMAHYWIITPGNSRLDQLNAGRAWVRTNLKATEIGLGIHPLSQALQEYPEMDEPFAEMRRQVGAGPNETLQMFGRVGYGPAAARTPRWPVETRLQGLS